MNTQNVNRPTSLQALSLLMLLLSYALMVNGFGHGFAIFFLLIIASKELGYVLAIKKYHFHYHPPYVLPFPYPFGSLGSFRSIKSLHDNPTINIDAHTRGIFYAFLMAVALMFIGLTQSKLGVGEDFGYRYRLGQNIISLFFHSVLNLDPSSSSGIDYHPIYIAGLAGTFTCALSLLPIGQLNGGFIMRKMIGKSYVWVSVLTCIGLFVLGFVQHYSWLLILSIYLLFTYHHQSDDGADQMLTPIEKAKIIFCLIIFILCFMPIPYTFSM